MCWVKVWPPYANMVSMRILLIALAMIMTAGCCDKEEPKSCKFETKISGENGPVDVTCKCGNKTMPGFSCPVKTWNCRTLIGGCDVSVGDCDPGVTGEVATEAAAFCRKGLRPKFDTHSYGDSASELCLNNLD